MSDDKPTRKDPFEFVLGIVMEQAAVIHAMRMALVEHAPRLAESIALRLGETGRPSPDAAESARALRVEQFLKTYEARKQ